MGADTVYTLQFPYLSLKEAKCLPPRQSSMSCRSSTSSAVHPALYTSVCLPMCYSASVDVSVSLGARKFMPLRLIANRYGCRPLGRCID